MDVIVGLSILVSIHAPAKGATRLLRLSGCHGGCFNSRPREGGDPANWGANNRAWTVSIHAPAKGATQPTLRPSQRCNPALFTRFQFTPPRRGRRASIYRRGEWTVFQFTPPRRGRPEPENVFMRFLCSFQFTPPRRGRQEQIQHISIPKMFQFTPPRRGRPMELVEAQSSQLFQFTPPRRGRPKSFAILIYNEVFQFTPPRRGRLGSGFSPVTCSERFNSRPREGGDELLYTQWNYIVSFNSRPREGGDSKILQITVAYYCNIAQFSSIMLCLKGKSFRCWV